jgi:succinoglycan biosynthesis transport protein ExoP
MIQLKTKIDKTKKKLREELRKEIDNIKAERSILASRESVLQKTTSDFENDALETNSKELEYSIYKRNVDTNQKLYDTLLSKVKESNLMGNFDVSNIRIAEKAPLPISPIKPKKKFNVILSIVLGLLTGIGLSFFWEYLDRSLRTEEDVERYLALPVLSVVPLVQAPAGKT